MIKIKPKYYSRLVYVSTLDGKLSALDVTDSGKLKWSIPTGPGPLLSSSIHRLELTNNGQFVRMIPSLSGGLYQFDGEHIEGIPITADNLLNSSFKFSDDLVISGGKETRSYGVSTKTGQIIYECSMNGCHNRTEAGTSPETNSQKFQEFEEYNPTVDEVIVVRRQTQTVRAIEPRTGSERWNFSIGHHEMEILKSEDCHTQSGEFDKTLLEIDFRVIISEGIICAVNRNTPNIILWKYKFDHPIVSAWKPSENDKLTNVDLFSTLNVLDVESTNKSPDIYVGMHEKQVYVQESEKLIQKMNRHHTKNNFKYPRIPWKPILVSTSGLSLIEDETLIKDESSKATALSVLYGTEYVNGNGFYLFPEYENNQTLISDKTEEKQIEFGEDPLDFQVPIQILIVSLWYYWKEILVISCTTALLLNMLIIRRTRLRDREIIVVERHIEVPVAIAEEASEGLLIPRMSHRSLSESHPIDGFTSRFQSDFDLVQCLGKGGFGVVFESKNKLDDCNYAIKRIILPNKQESKDRVMREVKTLANCEHQNIVRYFQAWVETPPSGWQEQKDRVWLECDALSTSIEIDSPTTEAPPSELFTGKNRETKLNSWMLDLKTNECMNFDDEIRKTKFSNNDSSDDSDSFIQFKDEELSNSVFENSADDSFEIKFQNSNQNSINNNSIWSSDKNSDHIISIAPNHKRVKELSIEDSDSLPVTPFKKTHRRPLSLDLTSRGNVIEAPVTKMYLYIQMQLCRKQCLRDWLRENDLAMRQEHIIPIFEQIVGAVEYVHLKGLIHRDLKPSNIFFSLDGQIKIGDFGLVTDMCDIPNIITQCGDISGLPSCDKHTEQVGTHLYMSPEQLKGQSYNYKVDIYSIGLIFFELLVVFSTEMERIVTLKNLRLNKYPKEFPDLFKSEYAVLKQMLSHDPNERPTTFGIRAKEPLAHQINDEWHFELPPRRRDSRAASISYGSNSGSSKSN